MEKIHKQWQRHARIISAQRKIRATMWKCWVPSDSYGFGHA